jgi:multiple sugar transport system ATP-binding protein
MGRPVIVGIRPESIEDASLGAISNPAVIVRVTVELREALGSDVLAHFRLDAPPVKTEDTRELSEDTGPATLGLGAERANVLFVARLSARSRVREGETVELHLDREGLHFFDPDTGASL